MEDFYSGRVLIKKYRTSRQGSDGCSVNSNSKPFLSSEDLGAYPTPTAEPALYSTWQGSVGVTKLHLAVSWHQMDHYRDLIVSFLLSKAFQEDLGQKMCRGENW